MIEGEPWFVAIDALRILGMEDKWGNVNTTMSLSKLGVDECAYKRIEVTSPKGRAAKTQRYRIVSESGLYKLIMRSDKPEAKAFQDWATLAPVDHQGAPMIDARALHGWLGPKWAFSRWVSHRIEEYSFEEGKDFFPLKVKTAGRPRTDYFLTINMAKELAMVERTAIGKVTRRYFIKMEEAALEGDSFQKTMINYQRKFLAPEALG